MDDLDPLDAEIAALSRGGLGARRIAAELGLTRHQVDKVRQRLGLRAPPGRRLEAGDRRTETRSVKLTPAEAELVDRAAGDARFTDWARPLLLEAAAGRRRPGVEGIDLSDEDEAALERAEAKREAPVVAHNRVK